jgi:hypothetical protein
MLQNLLLSFFQVISKDNAHDIFVNENGAVLDAYIFDGSEEEQKKQWKKYLLKNKQNILNINLHLYKIHFQ